MNNNDNRTFGLEFELGYPSEANFISLILDNINALEQYRDYSYDDDEELNQEDPSRESRLKQQYRLIVSKKHPKADFYTDYDYFRNNFLSRYYFFKGFGDAENPGTYELMKVILDSRGFKDGGWDVHYDSSIRKLNLSMEIVTPPLMYGTDSLNQVVRFCNWMQKYATVNETTGLHCHVDAKEFKQVPAKFTERLVLALFHYKSLEPVFDNLVMAHRQGNEFKYAKGNPNIERLLSVYRNAIAQKDAHTADIIEMFQDERYVKLNLHSLEKHGTLEFRQMHGTLNPTLVKNWVTVCVSFVNMVLSTEHLFLDLFGKLNKELEKNKQSIESLPREEIDHTIEHAARFFSAGAPSLLKLAIENSFYPTNIRDNDYKDQNLYSRIKRTSLADFGLSYVGFIEDKQLYRWYLDLTNLTSFMREVGFQNIQPNAIYNKIKNGIRTYFGTNDIYIDPADDYENPTLIAISIPEPTLNKTFGRERTIKYAYGSTRDDKTIDQVGQDFKQTQYNLAKNTPGINKSRAMAQVRQQTARRPLAEEKEEKEI